LLAARLAEGLPDPRQIAREAEVDMMLAGTVLSDGGHVRVSAELIHAPTGTQVGSYAFRAKRDNLVEVQDSLLRGLVEVLAPRLTERERRLLRCHRTRKRNSIWRGSWRETERMPKRWARCTA
jgi:hypothetical protein